MNGWLSLSQFPAGKSDETIYQEAVKMETTPVKSVNIDTLTPQLKQLVAAYHDALKFVEQQPFRVGKLSLKIIGVPKEKLTDKKAFASPSNGRDDRQRVIPRFARLFVESHIHNRLRLILRQLHIEQLAITEKEDARQAQINLLVEQMEKSQAMLFNWGRIRTAVTTSPIFSTLIAVFAPLILAWTGLNISSATDFTSSVLSVTESGGGGVLISFLLILLTLAIFVYIFFIPIIIQYGFRFKRAIFSGGRTQHRLFSTLGDNSYDFQIWPNCPSVNIYHLESRVFQELGVRNKTEFPLDFVLNVGPYYVFLLGVYVTSKLILTIQEGTNITVWSVLWPILVWFAIIIVIISGWQQYKVRKMMQDL